MPGDTPDTVGHAEIEIGDGLVMIADEFPDHGFLSPKSVGGTPVTIHVYVADADAVFAKAVAGGATATREMENQFYGDRSGQFEDPWGHRWNVASHVEDVSEEEMAAAHGGDDARLSDADTSVEVGAPPSATIARSMARRACSTFFSSARASASPSSAAARSRS